MAYCLGCLQQLLFSWGKNETKMVMAWLVVRRDLGTEQRITKAGQLWNSAFFVCSLIFKAKEAL